MKNTPRLEYARLAEALAERQLVERAALEHVLQQCASTGALMSEILVREHLVSDWDLARVACELYGLPYLPVTAYPPQEHALDGIEPDYLRQYGLVPLDRYEGLLTVTMPGLVPTEVLEGLANGEGVRVLPAVGSVEGNRSWLEENLPPPAMPGLEDVDASLPQSDEADGWAGILDAGDAAVQVELHRSDEDDED